MKKSLFLNIFLLLFINVSLNAIPASPHPVKITQPDGTEITIMLKGDEFFRYKTTIDGYLIEKDNDGFFRYAQVDTNNKIKSSGIRANDLNKRGVVERIFVKTLTPNPDFTSQNTQKRASRISASSTSTTAQNAYPLTGTPKSLVILVNFSDKSFVTGAPQTAFTNLLNQEGYSTNGGRGSARDYFRDASNGVFAPEFVVVGPYTLPQNMAYYGGNVDDQDKNPRQMVIDACKLADNAGIDFTQYDTDNNGIVDNVFVYYAGNNEAEGASENTIWPHRWSLGNYNTKFDGKAVFDYACTSELRGSSGANMCGIGTFAHEFGHVLGLPDYYATNNATHHTVSNWNIMDGGAYLDQGRTPPTYSAYDRFFLKWLQPIELKMPQNVTIEPLLASNKAYIITQNGNHNMNGANPSPVEFFTLENRQKTGWDTFLPASGMLVTRIYYSASTWSSNGPNNDPSKMGFDIIEADQIGSASTLSGDVFPGSAQKSTYSPVLRNGTDINKPLTFIAMNNSNITFRFMGGGNVPTFQTTGTLEAYKTVYGTPTTPQQIKVTGKTLNDSLRINFSQKAHFEMKISTESDALWRKYIALYPIDSVIDTTIIQVRYNPTEPSFIDTHNESITFSSNGAESAQMIISGTSTRPVYVVPPIATEAEEIKSGSFIANWEPGSEISKDDTQGYYITVYSASEGTTTKTEGFKNGLTAPTGWTINAKTITKSMLMSGDTIPAIQFDNSDEYIETEIYPIAVDKLMFYIKSVGGNNGSLTVEGWNESEWKVIKTIPITLTLSGTQEIMLNETDNYQRFRFTYTKATGSLLIDDVSIIFNKKIDLLKSNEWTTATSDTIYNLVPARDHFYKVKASDKTLYSNKTLKYENITAFSNAIKVTTPADTMTEKLRANVQSDGSVIVVLPEANEIIYIYNTLGQKIAEFNENNNVVTISGLPKGHIYILKAGNRRTTIII